MEERVTRNKSYLGNSKYTRPTMQSAVALDSKGHIWNSVVTDLVATVIPTERSDEESLLGEPEIPLPSGHRNDNS